MGGGGTSSRSTSKEDMENGASLRTHACRRSGCTAVSGWDVSVRGKLVRVLVESKGAPGTKSGFRCEQSISIQGRCWEGVGALHEALRVGRARDHAEEEACNRARACIYTVYARGVCKRAQSTWAGHGGAGPRVPELGFYCGLCARAGGCAKDVCVCVQVYAGGLQGRRKRAGLRACEDHMRIQGKGVGPPDELRNPAGWQHAGAVSFLSGESVGHIQALVGLDAWGWGWDAPRWDCKGPGCSGHASEGHI